MSNAARSGHSRSYPRGVGLDFRKLAGLTLMSYIDHHGVPVRAEAPPSELAVAVARHFEAMEVDEDTVIGGFLARLSSGREMSPLIPPSFSGSQSIINSNTNTSANNTHLNSNTNANSSNTPSTSAIILPSSSSYNNNYKESSSDPLRTHYTSLAAEYTRSTAFFDGCAPNSQILKRRSNKNAARPSEQVAAKVTNTDENGSWILASVQRFYADSEAYDVIDEDDSSKDKVIRLPWNHVMRLSTGCEGCFEKGTRVMAIFPDTTAFYRATVSKQPVWVLPNEGEHSAGFTPPYVKELILKFEDDEDNVTGRTPHRRVQSRYVIPLPEVYFHEDDDDVDLNPCSYKVDGSSSV
jgi:hypothetical protein